MMLKNYEGIRLVNTQAFDLLPCRAYIQQTAEKLNFCYGETSGSIRILESCCAMNGTTSFISWRPATTSGRWNFCATQAARTDKKEEPYGR